MKATQRRMQALLRAVVLAAAVTLTLGAATAHAGLNVPVVVGQSTAQAIFAEPLPNNSDGAIHNHLLSLINDTPEFQGARIRAAISSIDNYTIANALVTKASRGVDVKVVYPWTPFTSRNASEHRLAELGGLTWCDKGQTACISTAASGSMHAKFFLFSATGPNGLRKNVTWFGSANLTPQTGVQTWNNGLTVYDNAALFSRFETKIFNPMRSKFSPVFNDFYRPDLGQGYFTSAEPTPAIKVHASPAQFTDVVVDRLNEMTVNAGCVVQVGTAIFTREAVAYKLAAMKRGGCQVFVLAGMDDPGPTTCTGAVHMKDSNVKAILQSAGIPIRKNKIHDKIMLLQANNKQWRVLTGSHNLTDSALNRNDEILVEVASHPAYDAYSAHWWAAWSSGCTVT